jgi:sugar lactone lactonase YvrE
VRRRPVLNGRSSLEVCVRGAVRLACALALLGALAVPAQAASGDISTLDAAGALSRPSSLAWLADGSLLVADSANNRIRKIAPTGAVTTVAGTGAAGSGGDGGPATSAQLIYPIDVEATADGGFLIADYGNKRIRRVSAAGIITTVAGTGAAGNSGDNGLATAARLTAPTGLSVTADGGFLIADAGGHRVRRVSPGGIITKVAGEGRPGGTGDGGSAVRAKLNAPVDVEALPDGGFLVTEYEGQRVRRVSASGIITRVAGTGTAGASGDGGPATSARLNKPYGVSPTSDGGFLIADSGNARVRKVSAGGTITTVAGTGEPGYSGDGDSALHARLRGAAAAIEGAANAILIADTENDRVRMVEGRPPAAAPLPEGVRLLQLPTGVVHAAAGKVALPLACPESATGPCRGVIRLFAESGERRGASAARAVVIGRASFSLAAGDSKRVKVMLNRTGRRLLRKRREVRVKAVVARRGGPNIGRSTERTTFRLRRKRSHA